MYSYRGNPDLVYTSGLSVLATAYAVCQGVRSSHKVQADRPCRKGYPYMVPCNGCVPHAGRVPRDALAWVPSGRVGTR